MHHQRACRKEPARGSPLGRYAGRPRLTPGLKFEIRPIVRTLARCPAARRLRTKATLPGLAVSTDATWQAEIDQPSQELGMRRMSDTPHLSDILQPHQFPCSPVRCPEVSSLSRNPALAGNIAAWNGHMLQLLTGSSHSSVAGAFTFPAIAVARRHPGRCGSSSRSRIPRCHRWDRMTEAAAVRGPVRALAAAKPIAHAVRSDAGRDACSSRTWSPCPCRRRS